MRNVIHNCTEPLLDRAMRSRGPRHVFLWRGDVWRVRAISYAERTIHLYNTSPRKSIDDCTFADWTTANRAAIEAAADVWHEWFGGDRPVPVGTRVVVRYRAGYTVASAAGDDASARWHHTGTTGDIVAWRLAQ